MNKFIASALIAAAGYSESHSVAGDNLRGLVGYVRPVSSAKSNRTREAVGADCRGAQRSDALTLEHRRNLSAGGRNHQGRATRGTFDGDTGGGRLHADALLTFRAVKFDFGHGWLGAGYISENPPQVACLPGNVEWKPLERLYKPAGPVDAPTVVANLGLRYENHHCVPVCTRTLPRSGSRR